MFEHLRKSKASDVELREEVIKDLGGQKQKNPKKQLKRQVSSQFSNYIEIENRNISNSRIGRNNNMTDSSRQSDYSGKKRRENSIGGAGKF